AFLHVALSATCGRQRLRAGGGRGPVGRRRRGPVVVHHVFRSEERRVGRGGGNRAGRALADSERDMRAVATSAGLGEHVAAAVGVACQTTGRRQRVAAFLHVALSATCGRQRLRAGGGRGPVGRRRRGPVVVHHVF